MNFFPNEKYVWILPERTGSRAMGQILNFWQGEKYNGDQIQQIDKFRNEKGEFTQVYSHEWYSRGYDTTNFTFCLTTRNPYSRMLSYYKSLFLQLDCREQECDYPFKQFMEDSMIKSGYVHHLSYDKIYDETQVHYVVHLENIANDLISVPMIRQLYDTSNEFRSEWTRVIINNIFTKESEGNDLKLTEEDAEIVYRTFERQFQLFGYSEDSWRYL